MDHPKNHSLFGLGLPGHTSSICGLSIAMLVDQRVNVFETAGARKLHVIQKSLRKAKFFFGRTFFGILE